MCTPDTCCGMELLPATMVYSVLWIIWSIINISFCLYVITKPNEKLVQQAQLKDPIERTIAEFIRLAFSIVLLVGAAMPHPLPIQIYYGYGIFNVILTSFFFLLALIQKKTLEALIGLLLIVFYSIFLHLLIRRAYKSLVYE